MIDVETYGAAVGAAKRYTDEHSGSDDAVKYTEQSLTSEQQAQARTNIGAGTSDFSGSYSDLTDAPPIAKSNGAYAAAGGYYSTASGDYSFAFGWRVVTTRAGAVAFGRHNESSEDTAFAIGDGRDTQHRHNLMELKTDGTMLLNGKAVLVPEAITGYDATRTQTLKNINGTFTWVDDM